MTEREGGYVWYWARYGRVKLISVWQVSNAALARDVCNTDLGIRCIMLQIVLSVFATSLLGGEHVCRSKLVMRSCGRSRPFG